MPFTQEQYPPISGVHRPVGPLTRFFEQAMSRTGEQPTAAVKLELPTVLRDTIIALAMIALLVGTLMFGPTVIQLVWNATGK